MAPQSLPRLDDPGFELQRFTNPGRSTNHTFPTRLLVCPLIVISRKGIEDPEAMFLRILTVYSQAPISRIFLIFEIRFHESLGDPSISLSFLAFSCLELSLVDLNLARG